MTSLIKILLLKILLLIGFNAIAEQSDWQWLSEGEASYDTRNIYWSDNYKNYSGNWYEWAQGLQFSYNSRNQVGWGLDLAIYATQKITASYTDDISHPEEGTGGILSQDQQFDNQFTQGRGYARLGELAIGYFASSGYVRTGYFKKETGLTLVSNYTRATPSSYKGSEFKYNFQNLNFWGAYITEVGRREADKYVSLATAKEQKEHAPFAIINYVWNIGGQYQDEQWYLELDYSRSQSYLSYGRADASVTFSPSHNTTLKFIGQLGMFNKAGDKWDIGGAIQGGFTDNASHKVFAAEYGNDKTDLSFIFSYTQAENDKFGGYLFYWMAGNDHGVANFKSGGVKGEYKKNGEKELVLKLSHKMHNFGLPNLQLTTGIHYGYNIKLNGGAALKMDFEKENEAYLLASYAIPKGLFSGGILSSAIGRYQAHNIINPKLTAVFFRMYFDFKF